MADPFSDDEERGTETANDAAVAKIRAKVTEVPAEPKEALEVDLDDADDELAGKPQSDEMRESRNERRRNRYRDMQDRSTAAEKRAEEAERRYQQMFEMVQQTQRSQAPAAPAKPEADPVEEELTRKFAEQDLLYKEFNSRQGQLTATEHEEYNQKARKLQRELVVLGGRIAIRQEGIGKAPDERQIRATILAERLNSEHGDILSDPRKKMYADGVWRQMIASGRQDDWGTLSEAMETTRRKYGMATKTRQQQPSEGYKSRLSGMSRGSGGGGGGGSNVVTIGPEQKKMANAMYSHIPDENERYKRWAAGPGRKLREKTG